MNKVMNKQVRRAGVRAVQRHPRKALRLSLLALRHRKTVARMAKASRQASRLSATVKQLSADPRVAAEAKAAISELAGAGQRVREVGVTNVHRDDKVAAGIRQASSHVVSALSAARHPQPPEPKHRIGRLVALIAGAGVLGGAAYAKWKAGSPNEK